jgi:hypothetical protein
MAKRYKDKRSAGRSEICGFRPGEDPKDRHARRLRTNLTLGRYRMEGWCADHGIEFDVKNEGHHWVFLLGDARVEWWPSSAKLVVDKRFNAGIHCHDYEMAANIVAEHFGVEPPRWREQDDAAGVGPLFSADGASAHQRDGIGAQVSGAPSDD